MAREDRKRLDSWKDIARHLGRDLSTVRRWEKERGLPVHRLPGGIRQPVFALSGEIDAWLGKQESVDATAQPDAEVITHPSAASSEVRASRLQLSGGRVAIAAGVGAVALVVWFLAETDTNPPDQQPVTPSTIRFEGAGLPLTYRTGFVSTGVVPYHSVLVDLNRDGKVDIVYSAAPAPVIGVALGNGDGSFQPPRLREGCPFSDGLVVEDVNRDGHLDVAAACYTGDIIAVFLGNGDGTLSNPSKVEVPRGPRFVTAGDVDGNSWPDLLVTSTGELAVTLLRNHQGSFSPRPLKDIPLGGIPILADVNRDGRSEIVAGVLASGTFRVGVFQVSDDGATQPSHPLPASQVAIRRLSAVDLDGDGILDLLAADWTQALSVSRGQGKGSHSDFVPLPATSSTTGGNWWLAVADLDLDGRPDILTTDNRTYKLLFFRGHGDCTFAPAEHADVGSFPVLISIGDLNGDGKPDILTRIGYEERYVTLIADWLNNRK